ncbi:MAG: ATP-binding protein [Myxococcota bacterium]
MAQPSEGRSSTGPGNRTIATTLLELLAVRGRTAARERALRALRLPEGGLAEAPSWISVEALDRMFSAVDLDRGLARAIGHRLCAPDATGLSLYGLGLATPEKAYRRIQALLPRAARDAHWRVESMGDARAELVYEIGASARRSPERQGRAVGAWGRAVDPVAALHCALRVGQLEAIPGLYGLLPARVQSTSCVAQGDEACRYVVDWQTTGRTGLKLGAAAGLVLAGVVIAIASATGGLGAGWIAVGAVGVLALAGLTGRAVDLHRQLEAVAGARRGHLALFDQVDAVLAEKLDQLSRLDASLEAGPRVGRSPGRDATFEEEPLSIVDLRALVERAIEKARPQVVDWAEIRFDCEPGLRRVACEPVAMEQVVDELLQNAIEASLAAGDAPEIRVSLSHAPRGVELAIEDQGRGLDANDVDETFDPFSDATPIGLERGFGLPVCLRIVEAHGGELRIANPRGVGTRVTVLLPAGVVEADASAEGNADGEGA